MMSNKMFYKKYFLFLFAIIIMGGCHKSDKKKGKNESNIEKIRVKKRMIKSEILIRKKINGRCLRPLQLIEGINGEILLVYEFEKFITKTDIFDRNLNPIKKEISLNFKNRYPTDFFYSSLIPYKNGYIVLDWKRKMIINFSEDFKKYYRSFSVKKFQKLTNIYYANDENIILANNIGSIINGKFKNRYNYYLFNPKNLKSKLLFEGYCFPAGIKDDSYYFLKEDFLPIESGFIVLDRNKDIFEKYDYDGNLKKRIRIISSKVKITEEDKKNVIEERIKLLELIMKRKFSYYKIKKRIRFGKYFPAYSYIYKYKRGFLAVNINDFKQNYKGNLTVDIFDDNLNYKRSFYIPKFYNYGNIILSGNFKNYFIYSEKNNSFYLLGYENFGKENEKLMICRIGINYEEK